MMLLSHIEQLLAERWGNFDCDSSFRSNGKLSYMSNGLAFNYIFNPVSTVAIEEQYGNALPLELYDLYKTCNGMRLFISGLCIFGLQLRKNEMEPYSIALENYNTHSKMRENKSEDKNLIFFGSLGKDTVLAFSLNDLNRYMCLKKGSSTVIKEFASLKDLFDFFIPLFAEKYNENCEKIVPNEKYSNIPILANSIFTVDELNIV